MPWPSLRDVSAERFPARRRANAVLLVWITLVLLGVAFWSETRRASAASNTDLSNEPVGSPVCRLDDGDPRSRACH